MFKSHWICSFSLEIYLAIFDSYLHIYIFQRKWLNLLHFVSKQYIKYIKIYKIYKNMCLNNIFSKSAPVLKKYHHDTYKDKMAFWQWFFWMDKHQRWWNKIKLVSHRKNPSSISMVPLFLMPPFDPPHIWGWLCLGLLSSLCSLHHSETSLLPKSLILGAQGESFSPCSLELYSPMWFLWKSVPK